MDVRWKGSRRVLAVGLVALGVLAAGCSNGSPSGSSSSAPSPRPSSPARITLISPTNGQTVTGSVVHVQVGLQGARIVPATTTHITPTTGHIHVYLDNKIVAMNFRLSDDISNVSPGMHVMRVEFVASDHLPFDPRVFTAVTFEVKA
jgi:hypothetical protein